MAKFSSLPLEIIHKIIELSLTESCGHRTPRFSHLNNLSLVNKTFHDLTAPRIFRKYRLQVREVRGERRPSPTCFLTGASLLTWNERAFCKRLAHLREKAALVRELVLVDYGQPQALSAPPSGPELENGRPAPFDFSPVLPVFIGTLDMLSGIVSVAFEGPKLPLPPSHFSKELWGLLSRLKPERLSFDGNFTFPSSLAPVPSISFMSLPWSVETAKVIQVVCPAYLDLRVEVRELIGIHFDDPSMFQPYRSLGHLDVRVQLGHWTLPIDFFNFMSYPETQITIYIAVANTETDIEAPGAWYETEYALNRVFVDDLTNFDVRRDAGSDTLVISRPLPGNTGGVRDLNLPEDDENEETHGERDMILAFSRALLSLTPNPTVDPNMLHQVGHALPAAYQKLMAPDWA